MKRLKNSLGIFCCLICVVFLSSCAEKTSQTPQEFTYIMEEAGFTVQDVSEETQSNGLATTVLIAVGEQYQIEYYELTDAETGEGMFYHNKQVFDENYSVKLLSSEVTSGNYNYYAFNSGDDFCLIARIDNTMLWCVSDKAYREDITEIVKKLGYK